MKKRLVLALLTIVTVSSIRADEKFFIPEKVVRERIDTIAIMPSENVIWESMNQLFVDEGSWFFGIKQLISNGIMKPNDYVKLKDPKFVDSIAAVTDRTVAEVVHTSARFTIIPQESCKTVEQHVLSAMGAFNQKNPWSTTNSDFDKKVFVRAMADSLPAQAILQVSYQIASANVSRSIARWDGYSERFSSSAGYEWEGNSIGFSLVAVMTDRKGDTLWTGRYGLKVVEPRANADAIFEEPKITDAARKAFKKLTK